MSKRITAAEKLNEKQRTAIAAALFAPKPDFASYDIITVSSSAGKDSQAMLDYVMQVVPKQLHDRIVVVHFDLGRMEWKGTRELAEKQARFYGLPFVVKSRNGNDLLDQIEHERGKFPGMGLTRFCTSDHKTSQYKRVLTELVGAKWDGSRQIRVLDCQGIRAAESTERAGYEQFSHDAKSSNGKRHVDCWLPIFGWNRPMVWSRIDRSRVPYHPAYDLGMGRLSCVFCIYGSERDLLIAGEANPELLGEYVRVEEKIGHTFQIGKPIKAIWMKLQSHNTIKEAA